MIDTRYLIDPSGIVPEWIADNRDICDPREEDDYDDGDGPFDRVTDCSRMREDPPQTGMVVVDCLPPDDHRCIGIRYRDGIRTWSLVE